MKYLNELLDRLGIHKTASQELADPPRLMYPLRDWYLMLTMLLLILALSLGAGGYLFLGVSRGGLFLTDTVTTGEGGTIDRSLLQETLLFFEGESKEFEDLRTNPPLVKQPR